MDRSAQPPRADGADASLDRSSGAAPPVIQIHNHPAGGGWALRIVLGLLLFSALLNLSQMAASQQYDSGTTAPSERFVKGDRNSRDKLAVIEIEGMIMPPLTDRVLKAIEKAQDDAEVRGVVVAIDSPGGLVADSHRIYKALQKLKAKKPLTMSMGRIAASGGYYVAMGGGPETKIFAEEITWTGSIGVIIPRYNLVGLGEKFGVAAEPLKTGPLKDTLDPLRPLTDEERQVWDVILQSALDKFVGVIDAARSELDEAGIRQAATGQIYTAEQALELKLIDAIGDQDAAIDALQQQLQLTAARVVRYQHPQSLGELLMGVRAPVLPAGSDPFQRLLEASVPRAMYLFGGPAAVGD